MLPMKVSRLRLFRISTLSLGLASIMISAPVQAGEQVDRFLDVNPDGAVHIHNVRGDVAIKGWSDDRVRVSGDLDDLTEEFIFETDGKITTIRVEIEKRSISYGDGSDLDIWVPKASKIWFDGVSTDIEVRDIAGGTSIKSVSGDIKGESLSQRIGINTVSGDVELEDSTAEIKVTTVSGSIEINVVALRASLNTVSGDIEAELDDFERLSAESVSGDIELSGQLLSDGGVNIESVSGDIRLQLSGKLDAEIQASTAMSGDIDNRLNGEKPKDKFPGGARLSTKIGDGTARVRIGTVSGDIRLSD